MSDYQQRQTYAQAARDLRAWVNRNRHDDPTLDRLHDLLIGAAVILEGAGLVIPPNLVLRQGLDAMVRALDELRNPTPVHPFRGVLGTIGGDRALIEVARRYHEDQASAT